MSANDVQEFSPRSGPSKAVSIVEPESISPKSTPRLDGKPPSHTSDHANAKQHRASGPKRLLGRLALDASSSSLQSFPSTASFTTPPNSDLPISEGERPQAHKERFHHHTHQHHSAHMISQVIDWLQHEKAKKATRLPKKLERTSNVADYPHATTSSFDETNDIPSTKHVGHKRAASDLSVESVDLERLERILASTDISNLTPKDERRSSYFSRNSHMKRKNLRKSSTAASSDTDYLDGDAIIPSAEVVLDNSKTLGYSGGEADSQINLLDSKKRVLKEKEAWLRFKEEIVRLAHTLRLKGWRRVPLDRGGDIEVERLSGALTNAVYVVSPPANLVQTVSSQQSLAASALGKALHPPPKLLLRIYGPQVEHLINRESELQILRRLRRKKIGPCLLGTFINGRFEQFYYARTLTAADLRIPQTSKQIAKRMRELHDGVELLEEERDAGPFVWQNWDKWVERCEEVICWLDGQILSGKQGPVMSRSEKWKQRGLVCGVEWMVFRRTVEKYRRWLDEQYGGAQGIRQRLTQYGNLLRLKPPGESPLLTPANEHKQLVVIDFEYASANLPGLEFANHFTEWCYNYHDAEKPHALSLARYPTPEEQHRFLKAYIQHQPFPSTPTPSTQTPIRTQDPSSSVSSFVLDSRAPPGQTVEDETRRDEATQSEVHRLMKEVRIWRVANSAQWVAWGIVQAKVPGMNETLKARRTAVSESASFPETIAEKNNSAAAVLGEEVEEEEEEEFDYLAYAQERALFFWGDVLQLGIVRREDLPAALLDEVKVLEY